MIHPRGRDDSQHISAVRLWRQQTGKRDDIDCHITHQHYNILSPHKPDSSQSRGFDDMALTFSEF